MPLETPVTEHVDEATDTAYRYSGKKVLTNGWFGEEIPNLTTFAPNNLLTYSYYYISSWLKCYRF